MTKFRTSLIIFGILILCVAASLVTFLSLSATGFIAAEPINISLKVSDVTAVYDANPHTAYDFRLSEGELLNKHKVEVISYFGAQTNVGESQSTMSVRILDKNKRDVTAEYGIKIVPGVIRVVKRDITVVQENITAEYSGKPIINDKFTVSGSVNLCLGHRFAPNPEDKGVTAPTPVSEPVTGEYSPHVYDSAGNNVTDNYNIEYVAGTTAVTKRALTVAPVSVERMYNGKPLAPQDFVISSGSLADGHEITGIIWSFEDSSVRSITNVGELRVRVAGIRIKDLNADDYYTVTSTTGTLTVTPRMLTVEGVSGKYEYDGNAHFTADNLAESVSGTADGDNVYVTYSEMITNAGTAANPFSVTVLDSENNEKTQNYIINAIAGTLTVTPKTIQFDCPDKANDYTGNEYKIEVRLNELNPEDYEVVAPVIKNAGEYTYTVRLTDTENAANFRLKVTAGKVTVNKIDLPAYTVSEIHKVYDGSPASVAGSDFTFTDKELSLYVESAMLDYCVNAGTHENVKITGVILRDGRTGENVTANYNLPDFTAKVIIQKRKIVVGVSPITLQFGSSAWEDWEPDIILSLLRIVSGSLVDGDVIENNGNISLDIDEYSTVTGFTVTNADNYDFVTTATGVVTYIRNTQTA